MRIPALLLLVAVLAFGYDPADRLYEKGIKLVEQRKLKAARSTFETLIEAHPRSPRASMPAARWMPSSFSRRDTGASRPDSTELPWWRFRR